MCRFCEGFEEESVEEVLADELIDEMMEIMESEDLTDEESYLLMKAKLIEAYSYGYVDAKEEVATQLLKSVGYELDLA